MIKVAHVMHLYLRQSETFIWQYLSNFRQFIPVVLAPNLLNLKQFPLNHGHIIPVCGPRGSFPWLIDNWYRRILKRPQGYAERIIKKENIALIHAHFGPMGCSYLPISLSLKIPLITTFYGYDLSVKDVIEQRQSAYARLFKEGTYFLIEGPSMREKMISLGCPEEKILIQRIAIDLEQYVFKTRSWNAKRPVRFLFIGRFVEKKGLKYALRALANVRKDYSFEFRIIGGGELEQKLHWEASNLGLSEQIVWLGIQSHLTVIEEIQACDILIQPSVTASNGDSEGGAPTIILEAQASGLPVISTTHADIPYVTKPDESAYLVPERDLKALQAAIKKVLDNPQGWALMGKAGREHVEKFHDVKKEILSLQEIYAKCV